MAEPRTAGRNGHGAARFEEECTKCMFLTSMHGVFVPSRCSQLKAASKAVDCTMVPFPGFRMPFARPKVYSALEAPMEAEFTLGSAV